VLRVPSRGMATGDDMTEKQTWRQVGDKRVVTEALSQRPEPPSSVSNQLRTI
jgi:hypothetical protein